MFKHKKKLMSLCALCLVCAMAFSFAYFTDRAEVDAHITSGTVGLDENATENWLTQLQAGPQAKDNVNPGDSRSLAFEVTNTGTKAIDVRHTLKLSVVDLAGNPKAMSMGTDVNGEEMLQFDVFRASDVATMSGTDAGAYNGGYVLKDGATPVFSSDSVDGTTKMGASRDLSLINKGVVTYYFADSVLDGIGTNAETGYAAAEHVATTLVDDKDAKLVDANTVKYDYVLIFRDSTLNDFQGCQLYVEMVVEAKQHLNTLSSWKNVETVEYTLQVSGETEQNTTINTAPNNTTGVLEDVEDTTAGTYNTNTPH